MRMSGKRLVRALAAALAVVFVAAALAWAETCDLELKRLDQENPMSSNYTYRATYPQSFFVQNIKNADSHNPYAATFKRLVTKEPKYQSANPFRGVVKLGSQEFAFALDAVPPPAKDEKKEAKEEKTDADKTKKDEKKSKDDSEAKPTVYNRLYFDLNHNGDLTDDKVLEADAQGAPRMYGSAKQTYAFFRFPRVDVKLENDGVKSDYSFFLQGQSVSSPDFSYTSLSLNAGAYREGHITIDGKKRHVVLIDFNSNGLFGDEMKLVTVMVGRSGKEPAAESRPQQGDMLLIDPTADGDSPYDVTNSNSRNYVSKLINIDGKFYSMKISPAADKLTIEPSTAALGKLANPNGAFRAVICGDGGFLKIRGDKNSPAVVPEGEWKLLSYTIECNEPEKPKKTEEKKPEKKGDEKKPEKKSSSMQALAKNLEAVLGGPSSPAGRNRHSVVTAEINSEYKPVKVVKGETATLPFGPPYKPTVTADYFGAEGKQKVLSLGMSLIGSAGETCSNMTVNGGRPSKPKFTITDAKGKVIEQGSFEYG
jgi:hypothetical protein